MTGPLSKHAALIRAVALVPHPGTGLRTWMSIDAVLAQGVWVCVLEDLDSVHVVEVDSRTGDVRLAGSYRRRVAGTDSMRPTRSGAMAERSVRCGRPGIRPPLRSLLGKCRRH
jgi:hypothetical protein